MKPAESNYEIWLNESILSIFCHEISKESIYPVYLDGGKFLWNQ